MLFVAAAVFLAGVLIAGFVWSHNLGIDTSKRTQAQLLTHSGMHRFSETRVKVNSAGVLTGLLAKIAISAALKDYPPEFLRNTGPNIFIANEVSILGYPVAGTVLPEGDRGWVILAASYLLPTFNLQYAELTFHHEFSSLLIRLRPFPYQSWKQNLPVGFTFQNTVSARLDATVPNTAASKLTDLISEGFVSEYGRSSLENDINTYAELLMGNPEKLANLAKASEVVRRKAELIARFYASLHPGFAEYFSTQGLRTLLNSK